MPIGLHPRPAPNGVTPTEPVEVVEAFLEALASAEVHRATCYLAPGVRYTNVGLPTINGSERVAAVLEGLDRPSVRFEVYIHSIATNGPLVLNERTDVITFGPVRSQFWVCGRFEVHDGLITVWRDYFDNLDLLRGIGRGLLGALVPSLRPEPPESPRSDPGR
jgi:limonene-1,2-epoxide hydrolase